MSPKVSILVPIYNTSRFIEKCAISLFEQTFQDIEYIFINDCTLDNSIEVLEKVINKYPARKKQVRIINLKKNQGIATVRNIALENSNGEFCLFVDSDDYIELNMIELLYNQAIADDSGIVICDAIFEWESSNRIYTQNIGASKQDYLKMILKTEAILALWNKFFKRELYLNHNIKALDNINYGEDYFISSKLVYFSNRISKLNSSLYHYIQFNTNSYTKNISSKSVFDIVFILNNLTEFFAEKEDFSFYKDILIQAKIKRKIEMLMNVNLNDLRELFNIFPEVDDYSNTSFLTFREKIAYLFIKNKWIDCFILYRKFYNILFYIYKMLKGR